MKNKLVGLFQYTCRQYIDIYIYKQVYQVSVGTVSSHKKSTKNTTLS